MLKAKMHGHTSASAHKIFYSFFIFLLANLIIFTTPAHAITTIKRNYKPTVASDLITQYDQDDIMFYEKGACTSGSTMSGATLDADTTDWFNENALYIMANLRQAGYTDEAIAGIIGNLKGESSNFNPGAGEKGYNGDIDDDSFRITPSFTCYNRCGFGIAQWTSGGRQDNLQAHADSMSLPVISLVAQTDFLIAELPARNNYGPDTLNSMGIERATYAVLRHYETPTSVLASKNNGKNAPSDLATLEAHKDEYPGAWSSYQTRLGYAQAALALLQGASVVNASPGAVASNGSNVTIIGDSITNRSKSALLEALYGLSESDIHAQDSKQFYSGSDSNPSGYTILQNLISSGELKDTLVFALGTNSTSLQKSQVQAVVDAVHAYNPSGVIIFVNNYYYKDNDHYSRNNEWFDAVASENSSSVKVANWAAAAGQDPDKYIDTADGYNVHPTRGDGTTLFARTIAQFITTGTASNMSANITNCSGTGIGIGGNGVTELNVNGHTYAFPLAYATKDNYLRNSNSELTSRYGSTASVLSQPTGWGHHDYPALDLGIWMEKVDGHTRSSSDSEQWGGDSSISSEQYYLSSGATVVAITSGTITTVRKSYVASGVPAAWQNKCGSIFLQGDDGNKYYMTHISADSILVEQGAQVSAGQPLAEVGAPYCAQSTQAHLHIDMNGWNDDNDKRHSDEALKSLIAELYNALPDDAAQLAARQSQANSESGLTYEQAIAFMKNYGANRGNSSSNAIGSTLWSYCQPGGGGSNCVSFSAFFYNKFAGGNRFSYGSGALTVDSIGNDGVSVDTSPAVWSIFSWANGGDGHTGVILGYHDGKWIVGHASCNRGRQGKTGEGDGTDSGNGAGVVVTSENITSAIWGNGMSNIKYAHLADRVNITAISNYLSTGE